MSITLTNEPIVNVLISSYNYSKYLPECLDSVVKQDYERMHVYIYDDASTDNSVEIIEDYGARDKRFKMFKKFETNGGPNKGTNWMLDNANIDGEFIALLCSDDKLGERFWENSIPYFDDPDVGIVRVRYANFGEGMLDPMIMPFPSLFSPLDILEGNRVAVTSPFRVSMQKEIGTFDENTIFSDWDFWIRGIMEGWKWKDCPEAFFYRRLHPESITFKTNLSFSRTGPDYTYMAKKWQDTLKQYNMFNSTIYDESWGPALTCKKTKL